MTPTEETNSGTGLLVLWPAMSVLGLVLGLMLRQPAYELVFWLSGNGFVSTMSEGVVIGGALGLAQLLALPEPLPRSPGWVVAGVVGWGLGWGLGWSFGWGWLNQPSAVMTLIGGLAGLISGLGQWFILQPHRHRAAWWIPGSALAWAVGMSVAALVGGSFSSALAGAVGGLLTGALLIWLLKG